VSAYPDIPVACLESGMVMLLEKVVHETTLEACVQRIYAEQQKATIEGFPCPACRVWFTFKETPTGHELVTSKEAIVLPTQRPSCRYRPLRGPLFVPRS
jgi:hypothetical protein